MLENMLGTDEHRIGILGGSFDPIHIGHLILAETAMEAFELETVFFMPCADQPLKPGAAHADGDSRTQMILSAIEGNPAFAFLDIELARGGSSYTVDSLDEIHARYPEYVVYFLIGSDKVMELKQWKAIGRVASLCRFGVFPRPGVGGSKIDAEVPNLVLEYAATARRIEVSSSEIRHRVAEGQSIRYLVPDSVGILIAERHLYGA